MSDVKAFHYIFNKFITNILNSNIKYNCREVILTIIEGNLVKGCDASGYLSNIENVVFNDFSVKPIKLSHQYNGETIDCEWIKNCEFYNYKYANMHKPVIKSWSLLMELKNE